MNFEDFDGEIEIDINQDMELTIDGIEGSDSFEIDIDIGDDSESFSSSDYEQQISRPNHHFDGCSECIEYRNQFMVNAPFRGSTSNFKYKKS